MGRLRNGLFVAAVLSSPTFAECPPPEQLLQKISAIDRSASSRIFRFSATIPDGLYRRAANKPGRPNVDRDGRQGFGVIVAELPVELLWKAINDEDHHDMPGNYFTVESSVVVAGEPRSESRVLFQHFEQWRVGRWWATRMTMNRELYAKSDGKLWELWWEGAMEEVDLDEPLFRDVAKRLDPIIESRGSWLMAPIVENCTLIEFYSWSDPGGALGSIQGLVAKKTLRASLNGLLRMAIEHSSEPHDGNPFTRPDGSPILEPSERSSPR
jgi:hypothetical protein